MHHQIQHTVRLSDTDTTGQVYYARPLEWLEWCRVDWFQSHYGNFIQFVETTGITFFPSGVTVAYKRPLLFGDVISVDMRVKEIKKISFVFDYIIRRNDDVVLTAEIAMVCFDRLKKRPAALSPDIVQKLESIAVSAG